MQLSSERARLIDEHPCLATVVGMWPMEIGGVKTRLPFYVFPIDILCYNANNGRLAMDRRQWEADNDRQLDGCSREDAAILRDMLLTLDKDKTLGLKEDIRKKGQMEPGVISNDGVVINGNRRMAVIEELHREEPTGKWETLEAVRLPKGISEKDLWKIEAGLQLSKDRVAEYHPVNELLKIKEGVDRALTPEEVAAAMYGWKADHVKDALERLALIDSFLEFLGQGGNYGAIKTFGLHESFVDVQRAVIARAERRGIPKQEIANRVGYVFALMRAGIQMQSGDRSGRKGFTHWDIRNLDRVFEDAHARAAFTKQLEAADDMRAVAEDDVVEGFRNAKDILAMKEQRDRPIRLVEKAISALESINTNSEHFRSAEVREAMERLSAVVREVQDRLSEHAGNGDIGLA